jgi:hypothetical protein
VETAGHLLTQKDANLVLEFWKPEKKWSKNMNGEQSKYFLKRNEFSKMIDEVQIFICHIKSHKLLQIFFDELYFVFGNFLQRTRVPQETFKKGQK